MIDSFFWLRIHRRNVIPTATRLLIASTLFAFSDADAQTLTTDSLGPSDLPNSNHIFLPVLSADVAVAGDSVSEDDKEPLGPPSTEVVPDAIFLPSVSSQNELVQIEATSVPDLIFANGFESGDLSGWSTSVRDTGDLRVTTAAKFTGNYGLRALIDDNVKIYAGDGTPTAEAAYRARFSFDPNSIPMANGDTHFIFQAFPAASVVLLGVEFRFYNGQYQIRIGLRNDGDLWRSSSWFTISDAPHFLEISWKAATGAGTNNGYLTLWIDNTQRANLTATDNDTHRIERVQLGAVAGIDSGTRGTYYFDVFESHHISYVGPTSDPLLVAAGDIAECATTGVTQTAALLDNIAGTVITLGDNAYFSGSLNNFNSCYKPTWGRHLARTRPSVGNHEYFTAGAAGYYTYFGAVASPLDTNCTSNCRGYYSYELGTWHVIVLNSEINMAAGSTQEQWLRSDLAAHPSLCTLAYWHTPRFSSNAHGNSDVPADIWQALYEHGVDVVLNGHDHAYERFAPQTPDGVAAPLRGIRQFVVGTGGAGLRAFTSIQPNSEVRNSNSWGVLKMMLHATSYTWEFVPVAGQTFTDSGNAECVSIQ